MPEFLFTFTACKMRHLVFRRISNIRLKASCGCSCHSATSAIYSKRHVSTRTPLEISFNSKPQKKFDFMSKSVGLFGVPELSSPEGFLKAKVSTSYARLAFICIFILLSVCIYLLFTLSLRTMS